MGDFELNLFLNFGRHLFARIVRRFCSYIKQTPNLPTPKLRTLFSELPSSNFDLSGLASLRETSVIQRREQVFTRRRKGAKRSEVRVRGQTFATRLGEYHAKAVRFRRLRTITIPRTRTAPRTSAPPTIAQGPGRSPSASITQIGFNTGSISGISMASSAVTCFIASA